MRLLLAGSCASYCGSIFHQPDRLNHRPKRTVPHVCSLSRLGFTPPPSPKKQCVSTCLLQSFIISLVRWKLSRCTTTWLRLHDHLRCKIIGLTPRDGPNAPLPLFLLCRPLCCLTFTADSVITAVWEGIKRDVACSFSHLLNIQLHGGGEEGDWTAEDASAAKLHDT